MKRTLLTALILMSTTFLACCAAQRGISTFGYNTDYSYKKSNHPNSGLVSYGLDFGKEYGLSYGAFDYGNGDYVNCNYGNCNYTYDYGDTHYNYN